jgi:hypothetical protein
MVRVLLACEYDTLQQLDAVLENLGQNITPAGMALLFRAVGQRGDQPHIGVVALVFLSGLSDPFPAVGSVLSWFAVDGVSAVDWKLRFLGKPLSDCEVWPLQRSLITQCSESMASARAGKVVRFEDDLSVFPPLVYQDVPSVLRVAEKLDGQIVSWYSASESANDWRE